jgi:hypothetical protein
VVESKLPTWKGKDARFVELSTYSNMTVWDFKLLVAKHTGSSPLSIILRRADSKKPELTDARNCKLLSDLKFVDGETFTLTRASAPEVPKAPLLDEAGKTVPELRAIVSTWFETYSETLSRDQVYEISQRGAEEGRPAPEDALKLPESLRAMTRETCASFAAAITSMTGLTAGDERVTKLFDRYSRQVGNGHLLVESELQAFYQDQAEAKEDVVRQNLRHQGIQSDLKPVVDWGSLTSETDGRILRDEALLPRAKLAQNHLVFQSLLDLVEKAQGDEAEGIWDLLMSLPTNQQIEGQILKNENLEELLSLHGDAGGDREPSMFRVLYCLQIIKSLIFEHKQRQEGSLVLHVERAGSGQHGAQDGKAEAAPGGGEQEQQAAMAVENYEADFPGLEALGDDENPASPASCNRVRSSSLEAGSPAGGRPHEA